MSMNEAIGLFLMGSGTAALCVLVFLWHLRERKKKD